MKYNNMQKLVTKKDAGGGKQATKSWFWRKVTGGRTGAKRNMQKTPERRPKASRSYPKVVARDRPERLPNPSKNEPGELQDAFWARSS